METGHLGWQWQPWWPTLAIVAVDGGPVDQHPTPSTDLSLFRLLQLELSSTAVLHQMRRDQVTDTCRANSATEPQAAGADPSDLKTGWWTRTTSSSAAGQLQGGVHQLEAAHDGPTGRGKYSDPMQIPPTRGARPPTWKTLNQYSIPEINHRCAMMKFLFVWEALERLVSAYRNNKFTQKYNTSFHKRYGTKIIKRQRKNATQEALAQGRRRRLEEFVAISSTLTPSAGALQRALADGTRCATRATSTTTSCARRWRRIQLRPAAGGRGSYLKLPTHAKSTRTTDEMTTDFFQNISSEHQTAARSLQTRFFNVQLPSAKLPEIGMKVGEVWAERGESQFF